METYAEQDARLVAYLSAEFLPGPHLANNLLNLGILEPAGRPCRSWGWTSSVCSSRRRNPAGQWRPGRLASCSSIHSPRWKCRHWLRIRYEFGIFDQTIKDGWQVEITDKWLRSAIRGRSSGPRSRLT